MYYHLRQPVPPVIVDFNHEADFADLKCNLVPTVETSEIEHPRRSYYDLNTSDIRAVRRSSLQQPVKFH